MKKNIKAEFLKFVAENLSKASYINIMNKYQPEHKALGYAKALKCAKKYGLTRRARWVKR
jgi:uncharacterized Fe-S radical SAM superfamily protein PflX